MESMVVCDWGYGSKSGFSCLDLKGKEGKGTAFYFSGIICQAVYDEYGNRVPRSPSNEKVFSTHWERCFQAAFSCQPLQLHRAALHKVTSFLGWPAHNWLRSRYKSSVISALPGEILMSSFSSKAPCGVSSRCQACIKAQFSLCPVLLPSLPSNRC